MIIKVCGMTDQQNLNDLLQVQPDWFGMIFYPDSKRYMLNPSPESAASARRIGVFVNASKETILSTAEHFELYGVQLHGSEEPAFCSELQKEQLLVIKAFSVDHDFDFGVTDAYAAHVDYFLFDTKGLMPGGNGVPFNWQLLDKYEGTIPFLLAGGIGPEHVELLKDLKHRKFTGIDINSRFETSPGKKNIKKIKVFIDELRS